MGSPEDLYESGIFISDLSMHDCSRDYILAGSQQNPELRLALNQVNLLCVFGKKTLLSFGYKLTINS